MDIPNYLGGAIAGITLSGLLILLLLALGIIMLLRKRNLRGKSRRRTVIEIASTPVPHKHEMDEYPELSARLTRQGF